MNQNRIDNETDGDKVQTNREKNEEADREEDESRQRTKRSRDSETEENHGPISLAHAIVFGCG